MRVRSLRVFRQVAGILNSQKYTFVKLSGPETDDELQPRILL